MKGRLFMKIKVNQDACIGCGACTSIAEGVFNINDDGLSEVVSEVMPKVMAFWEKSRWDRSPVSMCCACPCVCEH